MNDTSLTDLFTALTQSARAMVMSSRDWAADRDLAWLYGIIVGWDDDPTGADVDQADAMRQVADRFGWGDDTVRLLRRLHAAVKAFTLDRAADLTQQPAAPGYDRHFTVAPGEAETGPDHSPGAADVLPGITCTIPGNCGTRSYRPERGGSPS